MGMGDEYEAIGSVPEMDDDQLRHETETRGFPEPLNVNQLKSTIYDALYDVQKRLVAPKSQFNKHGGYYYRSAEDIILGAKKVFPVGATLSLKDRLIDTGRDYFIESTATFHYAGAKISTTGIAMQAMVRKGFDTPQLSISSSSHARKAALCGLFAVDDDKDMDYSSDIISRVQRAFETKNVDQLKMALREISKDDRKKVWDKFTPSEQEWINIATGKVKPKPEPEDKKMERTTERQPEPKQEQKRDRRPDEQLYSDVPPPPPEWEKEDFDEINRKWGNESDDGFF
jgi:hypothetical protein